MLNNWAITVSDQMQSVSTNLFAANFWQMNPPGICVTMYPQKKEPWIIPTVSGSQSNCAFCWGQRTTQNHGWMDHLKRAWMSLQCYSPPPPLCCPCRWYGCWPCWRWPRPGYTEYQKRCRSQCQRGWRWCSAAAGRSRCSPPRAALSPAPPLVAPLLRARWSRHFPASSQGLCARSREGKM